ncbi:MAG: 2-phospho-L-lactate guanylyltransferase [Anaerolineae bacterium]|nr:2-phospho-L-lactate guanylyltransferase [Anaerolineae bacterium]
MSAWVVLPVKPLSLAKSRLADALTSEQRVRFAEGNLKRILRVLKEVPQVTEVLVISRDTRVLGIAREYGAKTVQESGQPALNPALMRATQLLMAWKVDSVLILPADLALLEASDVVGLVRAAGQHDSAVVLATDRHRDGTNALLVRPPGLMMYDYGVGSFARHREQAEAKGVPVFEYASERLKLDLDTPEDIHELYRVMIGHEIPRQTTLSEAFELVLDKLERSEHSG